MKRELLIVFFGLILIISFVVWISKEYINEVVSEKTNPVDISLEKEEYLNNSQISEPVMFIIFNNTHRSIYFLIGCAARFPIVEIQQGNEWKQEQYLHRPIVCTAIPMVEEIKPFDRKSFQWNQRGAKGLLEDGTYRFGLKYSYQKKGQSSMGETQTIYSKSFTIRKINGDILNHEVTNTPYD